MVELGLLVITGRARPVPTDRDPNVNRCKRSTLDRTVCRKCLGGGQDLTGVARSVVIGGVGGNDASQRWHYRHRWLRAVDDIDSDRRQPLVARLQPFPDASALSWQLPAQ